MAKSSLQGDEASPEGALIRRDEEAQARSEQENAHHREALNESQPQEHRRAARRVPKGGESGDRRSR
jgi:hypothetical protein